MLRSCFFICLFMVSSTLFSQGNKELWQLTDYVWNLGIASTCDAGLDRNPKNYFRKDKLEKIDPLLFEKEIRTIQSGDVLWVNPAFLPMFYRLFLSQLRHPVVLVISGGDPSFPSGYAKYYNFNPDDLISNKNIMHIFAQNCDYKGTSLKVTQLPIGVDFHSIAFKSQCSWEESMISPKEQEEQLNTILSTLKPTKERKIGAYVDFQLRDSIRKGPCKRYLELGEDRTSIFNKILPSGVIDYASSPMRRSDLWRMKGEYAFSVSPHGNGLDCHRTWEDLILGCIVIVKTSPLDPMYEGLPVVIIQDWNEITKENMVKWLDQYGDAFTNPLYREKLKNAYWIDKIRAAAQI